MTTYLGDKAVGIGTIKATKAVAGDVLHDETLVGNGNTEPLGVDKQVIATTNQVGNLATILNAAIAGKQDKLTAGENITIEDGVISATGGGSCSANGVHDSTLTGAGTSASPLGLSEAVKDEIADKAPKETVEALTTAVNDIYTQIGDISTALSAILGE